MAYRAMVLLAGPPGTGKSYLMERIQQRFPSFREVSFDNLKEAAYERHGFADQAAKDALYLQAEAEFFATFDRYMTAGHDVISDYPFGPKQHDKLQALCEQHHYRPLTIRLGADFDVLFTRQELRDLDPRRHPGHLVDHYVPGQRLTSQQRADAVLTRDEFHRRCTTRGYDTFQLGELISIDTTDFATVDYAAILDAIDAHYS